MQTDGGKGGDNQKKEIEKLFLNQGIQIEYLKDQGNERLRIKDI